MISRPLCARCRRPLRTCLCRWIAPSGNRVEVVILQHPEEEGNAKNTAGLLQLSLARCQLLVAETLADEPLTGWLGDPNRQNILLYPATPDLPEPPRLDSAVAVEQLRLFVLDATWRKSRKMLYLNPALQRLPRLTLEQCPPSRYRIRKALKPGQLSTLEATCLALTQLERGRVDYRPLLKGMDGMIDQLASYLPP